MIYLNNSRQGKAAVRRCSIVGLLVSGILTGCSSLTGPDRIEIPANTADFRSRLYAGASLGSSRLSPDTRGTVFNVDSNSDTGTQLRLGYDLHNMLAIELDSSVLGESTLREASTDVKYSSASISALVYGLSGVQLRSRRQGLSAYARLGYGRLSKSSAVVDLEESGAVPILGLGAEYGFSNGLGVRAEITRFDEDASYVGFGAVYRFGISPAGIGTMIAEAAEPALGAANTTVARDGRVLVGKARDRFDTARRPGGANGSAPARSAGHSGPNSGWTASAESPDAASLHPMSERWRPAMRAGDQDTDGVMDSADECPGTQPHVTVGRFGCGLFDAVLEDVTFKSGSRWLSPRARGQLDQLAETLLAFPESRVQVRAHTDSQGPADINLNLSSRRAEVVVQYLQSRGVHELQLQAVGMGEAQPIDNNADIAGRKRNRRVDVVTLPDQDAGHLLVASSIESARVIAVTDPAHRDPDRDEYSIDHDAWNSAPSLPAKRLKRHAAQAPGVQSVEPVLQAATAEEDVNPRLLSIQPLPVPGFAPGLALAGVVEDLGFPAGDSTLTMQAEQALAPIVRALLENPLVRIAVMAHTDDAGGQEANLALSRSRAESVVNYLQQQGVAAERMLAEGYGELLPLVQNVTEADRATNRRIEIRILRD